MTQSATSTCFNCSAELAEQSMFCGSCGINLTSSQSYQAFQHSPYHLDPVSKEIYRVMNINLILGILYIPVIFLIALASAFSDGGGGNFDRLFLSVIVIEILYIWIRDGLPKRKQKARLLALGIASVSLAYGISLVIQFFSSGLMTVAPIGLFFLIGLFTPHAIVIRKLMDKDVRAQFGSNSQVYTTPSADHPKELNKSGYSIPPPISGTVPNFGLDPVTQSIHSVLSSNLMLTIFYVLFALVYLDDVLMLKLSANSVNFALIIGAIMAYAWIRKELPIRNPKARTYAITVAAISILIEVYWLLNANVDISRIFNVIFLIVNARIINILQKDEVKVQFQSVSN